MHTALQSVVVILILLFVLLFCLTIPSNHNAVCKDTPVGYCVGGK